MPEAEDETYGIFEWRENDQPQSLSPRQTHSRGILLVHGMDESGFTWEDLAPALFESGYTVWLFRYPNDQSITASTAFLFRSLQALFDAGVQNLIFISHSMGGLVVRELLTNSDYTHDNLPEVEGLIMVAPPNHGSALARLRPLAEIGDQWGRFMRGKARWLGWQLDGSGEAGIDLRPGSAFLTRLNARPLPRIPMTIIAGSLSPISPDELKRLRQKYGIALDHLTELFDSVYRQAGDGFIALDSARLEQVDDFVILSASHLSIIRRIILPGIRDDRPLPAIPIILDRIDHLWETF